MPITRILRELEMYMFYIETIVECNIFDFHNKCKVCTQKLLVKTYLEWLGGMCEIILFQKHEVVKLVIAFNYILSAVSPIVKALYNEMLEYNVWS